MYVTIIFCDKIDDIHRSPNYDIDWCKRLFKPSFMPIHFHPPTFLNLQ